MRFDGAAAAFGFKGVTAAEEGDVVKGEVGALTLAACGFTIFFFTEGLATSLTIDIFDFTSYFDILTSAANMPVSWAISVMLVAPVASNLDDGTEGTRGYGSKTTDLPLALSWLLSSL